ncbi:hypothetical protein L1987_07892 [Smallanthus sonchifolius]|uniref:Uncharacterized protein n=1 Tax=Smallanthus sonchifolius TaxID=185202 RepID=A0ACB9JKV5_9ASTR|nr:hypothetical protein L1987_07892 [Smallanthus sonchifolius]
MYVCKGLTLTGGLCGWLTVVQLVDDGVTTVTHGITGIPMEGTILYGEIVPMLCSVFLELELTSVADVLSVCTFRLRQVMRTDGDAGLEMKSYPTAFEDWHPVMFCL